MKMETAFWIEHVGALEREAISASAYAKRHGISLPALYYWQHKLKAESQKPQAARSAGKFMALRVAQAEPTASATGCTLLLAPDVKLEMAALPAPAWLAALACAMRGAR